MQKILRSTLIKNTRQFILHTHMITVRQADSD